MFFWLYKLGIIVYIAFICKKFTIQNIFPLVHPPYSFIYLIPRKMFAKLSFINIWNILKESFCKICISSLFIEVLEGGLRVLILGVGLVKIPLRLLETWLICRVFLACPRLINALFDRFLFWFFPQIYLWAFS